MLKLKSVLFDLALFTFYFLLFTSPTHASWTTDLTKPTSTINVTDSRCDLFKTPIECPDGAQISVSIQCQDGSGSGCASTRFTNARVNAPAIAEQIRSFIPPANSQNPFSITVSDISHHLRITARSTDNAGNTGDEAFRDIRFIPTPPPTPIITTPSCTNGPITHPNEQIRVSWTNNITPVTWADISPDSNFSRSYHRFVGGSTSTTAPRDFGGYQNASGNIEISSNINYYVKLYNGAHSQSARFNIPLCSRCTQPGPNDSWSACRLDTNRNTSNTCSNNGTAERTLSGPGTCIRDTERRACDAPNCSSGYICLSGTCILPNCNSFNARLVCDSACNLNSSSSNTCTNNGTRSCRYEGSSCITTPAPSQTCNAPNCSSGQACVSGRCVEPRQECPATCHTNNLNLADGNGSIHSCPANNNSSNYIRQEPPACRTTGGSLRDGQCNSYTYEANCTGTGAICQGSQCIRPPTVDLKINNTNGPVTINHNANADLSWSVTNGPTSCMADLSWSGSKSTTGGAQVLANLTGPNTYTYRITCSNAAGTSSDIVQVNVLGLCSNTPTSCSACSAAANTCSTNNGTQNCTLVGPGLCTPTPNTQSCTIDRCSTGYSCNSGTCAQPVTGSCSPNPSTTITNEPVTWRSANVSGGIGGYNYSWSGTDGLSGTGSTVTKSYTTTGRKDASLRVTSGSQSTTLTCSPATINTPPPCASNPINCSSCSAPANTCSTNNGTQTCTYTDPGNCTDTIVALPCTSNTCNSGASCTNGVCIPTVNCSATPAQAELGQTVTWTAVASGGTGSYTYVWSGENLTGRGGSPVTTSYTTTGDKTATVVASDSTGRSSASTACFNSVNIAPSSLRPWLQTTGGDVHTQEQINNPGGP